MKIICYFMLWLWQLMIFPINSKHQSFRYIIQVTSSHVLCFNFWFLMFSSHIFGLISKIALLLRYKISQISVDIKTLDRPDTYEFNLYYQAFNIYYYIFHYVFFYLKIHMYHANQAMRQKPYLDMMKIDL